MIFVTALVVRIPLLPRQLPAATSRACAWASPVIGIAMVMAFNHGGAWLPSRMAIPTAALVALPLLASQRLGPARPDLRQPHRCSGGVSFKLPAVFELTGSILPVGSVTVTRRGPSQLSDNAELAALSVDAADPIATSVLVSHRQRGKRVVPLREPSGQRVDWYRTSSEARSSPSTDQSAP